MTKTNSESCNAYMRRGGVSDQVNWTKSPSMIATMFWSVCNYTHVYFVMHRRARHYNIVTLKNMSVEPRVTPKMFGTPVLCYCWYVLVMCVEAGIALCDCGFGLLHVWWFLLLLFHISITAIVMIVHVAWFHSSEMVHLIPKDCNYLANWLYWQCHNFSMVIEGCF